MISCVHFVHFSSCEGEMAIKHKNDMIGQQYAPSICIAANHFSIRTYQVLQCSVPNTTATRTSMWYSSTVLQYVCIVWYPAWKHIHSRRLHQIRNHFASNFEHSQIDTEVLLPQTPLFSSISHAAILHPPILQSTKLSTRRLHHERESLVICRSRSATRWTSNLQASCQFGDGKQESTSNNDNDNKSSSSCHKYASQSRLSCLGHHDLLHWICSDLLCSRQEGWQ